MVCLSRTGTCGSYCLESSAYGDFAKFPVLFRKIARELNHEADAAAKAASLYGFREPEFVDWVIRQPQLPNLPTEMAPVKPWKREACCGPLP